MRLLNGIGKVLGCRAWLLAIMTLIVAGALNIQSVQAGPNNVGAKKCKDCHKAEHGVWKGTKHFKSYRTVHKNKKAKKIVKAVGGKRMKKTALCKTCHYTTDKKDRPKSGPSCESCHGAAKNWINIHNDYGKGKTRDTEDAAHKAARKKNAAAAGMIWPSETFDVAMNCNGCHGLGNVPKGGDIAKMLDAGHPLNAGFELVKYSQGSVRHRFYPPKVTENQKMTKAQMSAMFVAGQGASLVAATKAIKKSKHAKFVAAQKERIALAKKVLAAVKGAVPAAGKVLSSPTAANGRALSKAVAGKDLTGAVGKWLPTSFK
ncbi:MAG: hypothetical protein CMM76_07615 [Rhodospirillaceae bacterium]|nr:hypothetical protein [Rhodospirillaceae bacterium]